MISETQATHEEQQQKDYARRRAWVELRKLKVPLDAIEALGALEPTPALDAAQAFLADPSARFLLLMGKKGTGKTVAGALVAESAVLDWLGYRNTLPSGYGVSSAVPADFMLAATFARLSGYAADDKAWFERLCSVRVLILDDFGAEHLGPFGAAMLDELVTRRHGARLRTVITSNLDKAGLKARLGERLHDRVSTSCVACVAVGESLRRRPQ